MARQNSIVSTVRSPRYRVREQGIILAELRKIDITVNEALRHFPHAPTRAMWYRIDQQHRCRPQTAREIAQTIVDVEQVIHKDRPVRNWVDLFHRLFVVAEDDDTQKGEGNDSTLAGAMGSST